MQTDSMRPGEGSTGLRAVGRQNWEGLETPTSPLPYWADGETEAQSRELTRPASQQESVAAF